MKKLLKEDEGVLRRRKQKRDWYRKNKSKTALAKKAVKEGSESKSPVGKVQDNGDLINIINAYYVLHAYANDGQTVADLNKVFTTIVMKIQR